MLIRTVSHLKEKDIFLLIQAGEIFARDMKSDYKSELQTDAIEPSKRNKI